MGDGGGSNNNGGGTGWGQGTDYGWNTSVDETGYSVTPKQQQPMGGFNVSVDESGSSVESKSGQQFESGLDPTLHGTATGMDKSGAAKAKGVLQSTDMLTTFLPKLNLISSLVQAGLGLLPQQTSDVGFTMNGGRENVNYDPRGNQQDNASGRGQGGIQAKINPTLNTIPTQATKIAKKATTADTELNPEEAAATAKEDERRKARQRVGLMQMRAVDPLFIEGLPDIFRSRAY